jgi:hypothetical protein
VSATPDITEALPLSVSGGGALVAIGDPSAWDVTFGSIGFNLKPSPQAPYQRGSEQVRKQQIDTSDSAGEQSLSSWWTRSQDSWDMGAGVRWYEPGAEAETVHRFRDCQGIDVWTPGELSLLRDVDLSSTHAEDVFVCGLAVAGVSGFVRAHGSKVDWVPEGGTVVSGTLPGVGATQPAAAGGTVWVGHNGGVSKFDAATGTVTTPYTCTGVARVWWVKARLICAIANRLYELTPGGSGVIETLHPTPLYEHPDAGWVWTDVAETGAAILAAGYADNDSAVFRFTLEQDSGGQLVLSGGSQVAKMPPTERVTCMGNYLGSYIVLGTSVGVRVGFAADDGLVQYGPLTVELDTAATDVTFRDRFAYLSVTNALPDGTSGAVRIDLSAPVGESGRFAWAWDASAKTVGESTSIALVGDRVVVAADRKVFVQSATQYVASGWLDTGGIRFRTVEPKAFRLARLVCLLNGGRVALTSVTPSGAENRVVEFAPSFQTEADVAIQAPGTVHQYLSFRITLTPSDAGQSPVVSGLVIKAVPAASRVRLFQYPLSCFDFEEDRYGNRFGDVGYSYLRLKALEDLEETGRPVRVADNRTGEVFTGQIETVDFRVESAPDGPHANYGGVALVVVRRL